MPNEIEWISLKGSGTLSPQRQQLLAERGLDVEEQDRSWKVLVSKSHQLQMWENPAMSMRIPGVLPKASQSLNNTLRIGHSPLFTDVSYSALQAVVVKLRLWGQVWKLLRQKLMIIIGNYWSISFETSSVFSMFVQLLFVQVKVPAAHFTPSGFPLGVGKLGFTRPAATECLMLTSFAGMVHQATRMDPKSILGWVLRGACSDYAM